MTPPDRRSGGRDQEHGHAGHEHGEAGTHDHHYHDVDRLTLAVVTVSSSRAADGDAADEGGADEDATLEDAAGDAVERELRAADNDVAARVVVPDDVGAVREAVRGVVGDPSVDAVVTTGGTGVTPDDVTVEAVEALFEKHLPGFGELFRQFSREEVGTRVVGTRATAGIVPRDPDAASGDGVPVFCLPGSENAARLGTRDIVVPEAPHLAGLARR